MGIKTKKKNKMTNSSSVVRNYGSTENNGVDVEHGQTAILIENEQLRAENEAARAILNETRRKQEENRNCCGPGAACGALITIGIIIYNIFVMIYNSSL